ncbi:MAG: BsuPI-related putative proteinase inhibitor [Candidatus Geothermincolia bacterium]
MRRLQVLASVAAMALLAAGLFPGCSAGPAGPTTPSNKQMSSAVQKEGGISVTLRSVPAVTPRGGTFALTLNVRNLSGKQVSYDLPSGQAYEFVSFLKGGDEVWRWSRGMVFTQAVSPITLAPGDSLVYKVAWSTGSAQAGLYSIQGYFLGLPDVKPTVSVELTPG